LRWCFASTQNTVPSTSDTSVADRACPMVQFFPGDAGSAFRYVILLSLVFWGVLIAALRLRIALLDKPRPQRGGGGGDEV
jgi:hypothetical protein